MARTMGLDKNLLSADDICKILEASSKAGVTKLTVRGLEVLFTGGYTQEEVIPHAEESPHHEAVSLDSISREHEQLVQEKLATMLIDDPVEYERLTLNGELTDEDPA